MRPLHAALAALLIGCAGEPPPPPGVWSAAELAQLGRMRLRPEPPPDPTNAWAQDEAARALGSVLFFDPGLSATGTVACATCHKPEKHFADGQPLGQGLGQTDRHTPTVVGSQWGPWFFWDGRADSLWSQALGPIEAPPEMGGDRVSAVRYATTTHRALWEAAFGPAPDLSDRARFPERARPGAVGEQAPMARAWEGMDPADQAVVDEAFSKLGKAIAAYERTLVPREAPFDRYVDAVLAGEATGGGALTEAQVRGLDLFLRKGQCVLCHNGPLLSDRAFHNNGVAELGTGYDPGRRRGAPLVLGSPFNCRGPYSDTADCPELDYLDPSFEDFQAAFKTPTLRHVAESAPYFHNGSAATLHEVVAFYSELPDEPPAGHRELTLRPARFSPAEAEDLVAFLAALSGEPVRP